MRTTPLSRRIGGSGWAFRASNAEVLTALARGEHGESLREMFGARMLEELSALADAARKLYPRSGAGAARPRVLIVPGMMGSRLTEGPSKVLWVDPTRIRAGHLERLSLFGKRRRAVRPAGALLPAYARLKLELDIEGFDARFFAYDWRLGIDRIGAALASRIVAGGTPVCLVAHSMGGLVARVAAKLVPKRLIKRLIMLGTPNQGAFSPVLALRGTYPFVLRLSRLDLTHSAEQLATGVFCSFPGLYQLLPVLPAAGEIDLLDPRSWPDFGPQPDASLLGRVREARSALARPDERMSHIVGVNRETVVSVKPTAAGFEYGSSRNGDGTVPVDRAMLPESQTYFVDEAHGELANNPRVIAAVAALLRAEGACSLSRRFTPSPGAATCFDDAQLRAMPTEKIDWRSLDSAGREAVLAELDGGRMS